MLLKANFKDDKNVPSKIRDEAEQTDINQYSEKRKLQSPLRIQNPKCSKIPKSEKEFIEGKSNVNLEFSLGIDDISNLCDQLNSSSIEAKEESKDSTDDSDEEFVSLA